MTTDLQHIHIKDTFPPPYELLQQDIVIPTGHAYWAELSYVHINLTRPCNKPPICGSGPIVNIVFLPKCPTNEGPTGLPTYKLPTTVKSNITLTDGKIDSKWYTPSTLSWHKWTYGFGAKLGACTDCYLIGAPPAVFLSYSLPWPKYGWTGGDFGSMYALWTTTRTETNYPWMEYNFIPNKADLDQSGHVDITDLSAIAKQYGNTTANEYDVEFAKIVTTGGTGGLPVDLLDVVYVAKYFCKDITPKDPHTGLLYDP
jgi:hypothetical protein